MTLANRIKRSTKPLTVERSTMCADYCIKWNIIDWDDIWYCRYQFIDGSYIDHRGYMG